MSDIATSVLTRLKNKAAESGRSNQLCMQLFCQEEFLRRVERSPYVENLVLKGGLFLYSITNFDSRVTVDVDFMLRKQANTPERLQEILEEIIVIQTGNDFVTFEIKKVVPISLAKEYNGLKANLVAKIKNTRTPFSIDFGVGDAIAPVLEKRILPTQLTGFDSPIVNTYSIEAVIAEKLDAILDLMEFSSRMKDYFDIYYLARRFDFEGSVLTESLRNTFVNRKREFTLQQFDQLMAFEVDRGMHQKWKAFNRKINGSADQFKMVLQTIHVFLYEPFQAIITNTLFDKIWSASCIEWKDKP